MKSKHGLFLRFVTFLPGNESCFPRITCTQMVETSSTMTPGLKKRIEGTKQGQNLKLCGGIVFLPTSLSGHAALHLPRPTMSQSYIDDQDFTRVTYTGAWMLGGVPAEYESTDSGSTVVGSFFTVSFQGEWAGAKQTLEYRWPILSEGNSIVVYGTIDSTSGGVTTNYSIDGGAVSQAVSLAGSGDTYKQQFWQSDTLQLGGQWAYDVLHPPRFTWGWLYTAHSTSRWQRWTRTLKLERGLCGLITSLWQTRLMPRPRTLQLRHWQPLHLQQRTRTQRHRRRRVKRTSLRPALQLRYRYPRAPRPQQRATWGEFWVVWLEGWFWSSLFSCVYGARTILERLRNSNQKLFLTCHLVSLLFSCLSTRVSAIYLFASQQQEPTRPHHLTPTQQTPIHFLWATEPSAQSTIQAGSSSSWAPIMQQKSKIFPSPRHELNEQL